MHQINVLVSGVGGGGVGEQIVKALRQSPMPYLIIGTDITPFSKGVADTDRMYLVPPATAPEYIDTMLAICRKHTVAIAFPGSEQELCVLGNAREKFNEAGVILPINPDSVISLCHDKFAVNEWLAGQGFNVPRSILINNLNELDRVDFYPLILKPVSGSGSKGVFLAQDPTELQELGSYLFRDGPFVAQEYVGLTHEEYTVGVLHDLNGCFINSIALRRRILSGMGAHFKTRNRTGRTDLGEWLAISSGFSQGEIGPFPEVTATCEAIASRIGSKGSINIQLRIVDGEVVVFEINPRFSGTTSLRALVGYNEPDILIRRHLLGESPVIRFQYRSGTIMRGLSEALIDVNKPSKAAIDSSYNAERWDIGPLPFYFHHLEQPTNASFHLPDVLPFSLIEDPESGLVMLEKDSVIEEALVSAYEQGSLLSGCMSETGIGRRYAEDYYSFVNSTLSGEIHGQRVLEIGCGSGFFLSMLKNQGAKVQGVEPGPLALAGSERYNIDISNDFFPCTKKWQPFDVVTCFNVLEHILDTDSFLHAIAQHLKPDGLFFVSVPDCEAYLRTGDISCLLHEHWAYYTKATLSAVLQKAGFSCDLSVSKFGGNIYAACRLDTTRRAFETAPVGLLDRFKTNSTFARERLRNIFVTARMQRESVGIMVPNRLMNALSFLNDELSQAKPVRFFDDNPLFLGKFLPGFPYSIEAGEDLVAFPPDVLIIGSRTFEHEIIQRLTQMVPRTKLISWTEIFGASSFHCNS